MQIKQLLLSAPVSTYKDFAWCSLSHSRKGGEICISR